MKNEVHTRNLTVAMHPGNRDYTKFACLEQRYGVTSDQIREIICIVGDCPDKVDEYLRAKLFSYLAYMNN